MGLKESSKTCVIYYLSLPQSRPFPPGSLWEKTWYQASMCRSLCSDLVPLLEGTVVHASKRSVWGPSGFPKRTISSSLWTSWGSIWVLGPGIDVNTVQGLNLVSHALLKTCLWDILPRRTLIPFWEREIKLGAVSRWEVAWYWGKNFRLGILSLRF